MLILGVSYVINSELTVQKSHYIWERSLITKFKSNVNILKDVNKLKGFFKVNVNKWGFTQVLKKFYIVDMHIILGGLIDGGTQFYIFYT